MLSARTKGVRRRLPTVRLRPMMSSWPESATGLGVCDETDSVMSPSLAAWCRNLFAQLELGDKLRSTDQRDWATRLIQGIIGSLTMNICWAARHGYTAVVVQARWDVAAQRDSCGLWRVPRTREGIPVRGCSALVAQPVTQPGGCYSATMSQCGAAENESVGSPTARRNLSGELPNDELGALGNALMGPATARSSLSQKLLKQKLGAVELASIEPGTSHLSSCATLLTELIGCAWTIGHLAKRPRPEKCEA